MASQSINQVKKSIRIGAVMTRRDFGIASAADRKIVDHRDYPDTLVTIRGWFETQA
jgi:hypothetical protein